MKKTRKNKVTRLHPVICTLSLFAFIATAAVTTFVVKQANTEVENRVIASADQVPKSWNTATKLATTANLQAEVLANNYVEYTATVTNSGSQAVYITHFSSYLSNSNSEGFIPLGDHNIEYTYTPDDTTSWRELGIVAPSNSQEAFALTNQLYVSPTNTVYLRYYVSPESTVTDLSDKIAVLLADSSGHTGYAEDIASIDYATTVANLDVTESSNVIGNGSDTSETYAEPLGVFSFAPSISATSSTVAKAGSINATFIKNAVKAAIAFALALIICILAYFFFFRRPTNQPKSFSATRRKARK